MFTVRHLRYGHTDSWRVKYNVALCAYDAARLSFKRIQLRQFKTMH